MSSPLIDYEANKKRPLTSRPKKTEAETNMKIAEQTRTRFVSPILSSRARKLIPMSMATNTPKRKIPKSLEKNKV